MSKTELLLDHARRINEAHHTGDKAARTALDHYHQAGILLAEVKAKLPHGAWLPWLEANFDGTPRTAQRYVKLADNWEAIANATDVSYLTLSEALGQLENPKDKAPKRYEPTYAQYMRYKIMPDIVGAKWERFKESIRKSGVFDAILVDEDGNILDGHMRVKACQELKKEGHEVPPYEVRVQEGLERIKYVVWGQTGRCNYTESQLAAAAPAIEKALELEAQETAERAQRERDAAKSLEGAT